MITKKNLTFALISCGIGIAFTGLVMLILFCFVPKETVTAASARRIYFFDTPENSQNKEIADDEEEKAFAEIEREMLAKIAMAEAEGEDIVGKALVICVVLNRAQDNDFPDSIWEVITEPGQFEGYSCGRYDALEPNEDCWTALEMVESGWDESRGALYFEVSGNAVSWQNENLKILFAHGKHTFYTD